jgi:hypothetical protein
LAVYFVKLYSIDISTVAIFVDKKFWVVTPFWHWTKDLISDTAHWFL